VLNINKKVLGISIPYYKNSNECEITAKNLMKQLDEQLTDDMLLYIYEDGQFSNWLLEYGKKKPNIIKIKSVAKNKGVSVARNYLLDQLIDKVEYILFLDMDDKIDDDYLKIMYEYCADMTHEVIESIFTDGKFTTEFQKNKVRSGTSGVAIQTKIIGNIRFDENRQIGEDTKFSNEVIDLTKYRKKQAKTKYYYQYGINPNSLIMRYKRKEIGETR
jgi:glycosyltransferase involved in cell wall biosynthesis